MKGNGKADVGLPPLDVKDQRLRRIIVNTWKRLPRDIRAVLLESVVGISELPQWGAQLKQALYDQGIKRSCSKWNPYGGLPKGEVQFSKSDCMGLADEVMAGSFLHELGHAYQTALTPDDLDAVERAGDQFLEQWGFTKEIDAVRKQRQVDSK